MEFRSFKLKKFTTNKYILFSILILCFLILLMIIYHSETYILNTGEGQSHSNLKPKGDIIIKCDHSYTSQWFPDVKGDNITGWPMFIVPNIVHYIVFDKFQVTFTHYLSILSVVDNHNPDEIIIHCNCDDLEGSYWDNILVEMALTKTVLTIRKIEKPLTVWENPLSKKWFNLHSSDVLRLRILMEFGGIFINNDVVLIESLDKFRRFEMTVGRDDNKYIGNQVLIANRKSRFLHLWYHSYKSYNSSLLFYNSKKVPTKHILNKYSHLTHCVGDKFGFDGNEIRSYLHEQNETDWKTKYYAVQVNVQEPDPLELDVDAEQEFFDQVVNNYETTFGQIARSILSNKLD